jgi:hypothetical protein
MKPFGDRNMLNEWIAVENHRLQIVKEWPDSPYKESTLTAIHFTLLGLSQDSRVTAPGRPRKSTIELKSLAA